MSSRLFIAKSPSLSGLEAFVADLVSPVGSSGSPLQILKAKCRELARAESAIIVCPAPFSSVTHFPPVGSQLSLWVVAKKDSIREPRIVERFKQLGIRVRSKLSVSIKVVQSCYQFTIVARLAPKWNLVTDWIIKAKHREICRKSLIHVFLSVGSEFLTSSRAQAIKLDVGVTDTEVTLNVLVNKLAFHPLKPEDLNPPCTVLQSFNSNHDYIIQETSIYNNRCVLLPNLSNGYIYSTSHHLPSSQHRDNPFQSYNQIRLHWKKQYGILLPEDQGLFYQVYFNMNPTQFFTYPGCCVLKAHPTSYPSREADAITAAFIADIHSRLPTLCGTALRYSSKSFTPTVGLLPLTAIGAEATSRAVNLQPRSQPPKPTPKTNLRYYPTSPPSKLSSQPAHAGAAHVASLPTHSAALGPQPSKPPPKKKMKFDTPISDSIQSQKISTALARTESTATRTAGASMRPGLSLSASNSAIGQTDNATSIQSRQSTTALSAKDGIINVPGSRKAALNSSESSRKAVPSVGDATRNRISVCSNAVLKKWLIDNGVQCRARERKEVLIRLVTQHIQNTGKTFNL